MYKIKVRVVGDGLWANETRDFLASNPFRLTEHNEYCDIIVYSIEGDNYLKELDKLKKDNPLTPIIVCHELPVREEEKLWKAGFVDTFFKESVKKCLAEVVFTTFKNRRRFLEDSTTAFAKILFKPVLKSELKKSKKTASYKFSLVSIDCDNFKKVNDSRGHVFGDMVLERIVKLVQLSLRENDVIFRLGGDEFGIIFPGASLEDTQKVMKRIYEKVIKDEKLKGLTDLGFDISVGITESLATDTVKKIVDRSDKNMYKNKRNNKGGKNGNNKKLVN